jgi:hypothetical protein
LSLWYKPNSVLTHIPITAQINGIGTTPVQFVTTGTIVIPANRRILVTVSIYCEFLNNGGYLLSLMDGGTGQNLNQVNIADPQTMFGESVYTPPSGGHVFSVNAATLSAVMNVRGDVIPGWLEVRDWGAV